MLALMVGTEFHSVFVHLREAGSSVRTYTHELVHRSNPGKADDLLLLPAVCRSGGKTSTETVLVPLTRASSNMGAVTN